MNNLSGCSAATFPSLERWGPAACFTFSSNVLCICSAENIKGRGYIICAPPLSRVPIDSKLRRQLKIQSCKEYSPNGTTGNRELSWDPHIKWPPHKFGGHLHEERTTNNEERLISDFWMIDNPHRDFSFGDSSHVFPDHFVASSEGGACDASDVGGEDDFGCDFRGLVQ